MLHNAALLFQQLLELLDEVFEVIAAVEINILPDFVNGKEVGKQSDNLHEGFHIGLFLHGLVVPGCHGQTHLINFAFALQLATSVVLEAGIHVSKGSKLEVDFVADVHQKGSHVTELGANYAKIKATRMTM